MKPLLPFLLLLFSTFSLFSQRIQFINLQQYNPPPNVSNAAYCPNSLDDIVGAGGSDFNGRVQFSQRGTWQIETFQDHSTLFLVIDFSFIGLDNPNVSVRGQRKLKIFSENSPSMSIVGFRQSRETSIGWTPWMTRSTGIVTQVFEGDNGIFCEGDNDPDLTLPGGADGLNDIRYTIEVKGDTGGGDISNDRNCECDTRVISISWENNIHLAIATDIDRDGIQDTSIFPGLVVDTDVATPVSTREVCIYRTVGNVNANIHNGDCLRFYGRVDAVLTNATTDRRFPLSSSSRKLIDWENGRSDKDYTKRDLSWQGTFANSEKVCYDVPINELNNNNVTLILSGERLRGCHKNCDLCGDYNCNVNFQNSRKISLTDLLNGNPQTHTVRINATRVDPKSHFLEIPVAVEAAR